MVARTEAGVGSLLNAPPASGDATRRAREMPRPLCGGEGGRLQCAVAQVFGNEIPRRHNEAPTRRPARYLVVVESGGVALARLFIDTREQVGEFDASTEEVTVMTQGLVPAIGAAGAEWDGALAGHSMAERREARVYTLDV